MICRGKKHCVTFFYHVLTFKPITAGEHIHFKELNIIYMFSSLYVKTNPKWDVSNYEVD